MKYEYIVYRKTKDGPLFMTTFLLATVTARWTNEYPDAGYFTKLQAQAITKMVAGTETMKGSNYGKGVLTKQQVVV